MAKTTKESKSEFTLNVNSLEIRKNALYIIEHKLDKTAPDGYQDKGATKLPSEGIGNTITCRFVDRGGGKGHYDTGLYTGSPCYEGISKENQSEIVSAIRKHIVEPYEEIHGLGTLEISNVDFWDSFTVDLYEGRVFNTDKVEDLLDLYIAVRSFDLTPADKIGAPEFSHADYVIKDASQSVSVAKRRVQEGMEADYSFMTLAQVNPEKLRNIMKFLNIIRVGEKPEIIDLQTAFKLWLAKDIQNAETFLRIFKKAEKKEYEEEIILHVMVKKMMDSKKIQREGNDYLFDGVIVGVDVKTIVHNLLNDPELSDILDKIRLN